MAPQELMLVKNHALVIVGPPGCGKTLLAKAIAEQHGTYAEMPARCLGSPFDFGHWLAKQVDTLIVEGAPPPDMVRYIKGVITSPQVEVHRKGEPVTLVRSPNLIFCTGHLDWIGPDDRRFLVHRMSSHAGAHQGQPQ